MNTMELKRKLRRLEQERAFCRIHDQKNLVRWLTRDIDRIKDKIKETEGE